ncbi:toxin Tbo-IT2-like [Centruroides vittatus]|uniref:U8-agatoxin-Ao1a-like n=1 Tax=Centruroides sculpturatus TaxID=218467 RepID=UPI000C6E128F|nr:U8-agatoxin-Ao1a-like [Centruroides sculpturatus]XP_023230479.1 U8-agatoxin-Ao1a-like [Centruroides sculpturatus]
MNCVSILVIFGLVLLADAILASPYTPTDDEAVEDYSDRLENLILNAEKRNCIRRGKSCDNKPNGCCENSSCRCNLWGTNCRCQRAGLFQRWGK